MKDVEKCAIKWVGEQVNRQGTHAQKLLKQTPPVKKKAALDCLVAIYITAFNLGQQEKQKNLDRERKIGEKIGRDEMWELAKDLRQ